MIDAERLQAVEAALHRPMDVRRRRTEAVLALGYVLAAVALAVLGPDDDWPVGSAVALVALFALALRVKVRVGVGWTTPVQLAFVPMLLLLPVGWVPLLVLGGWLLGRLPDLRGGAVHPDRLLVVPGACWFAIGPALVLALAGHTEPSWGDWPLYLGALAAQAAFDLGFGLLGELFAYDDPPNVRAIALSPGIDALLSPAGLLAALAAVGADPMAYAYLLLAPLVVLLAFYARERTGRLDAALALADAAREREELIATASHELNTPLGVMTGLHDWLGRQAEVDPRRRAAVHAAMGRELERLRQRVVHFNDFVALRSAEPLRLELVPTPAHAAADRLARRLAGVADVRLGPDPGVTVRADRDRLDQALASVAKAALGEGLPLRVEVAADATAVRFTLRGGGRHETVTAGLDGRGALTDLFVARSVTEAQGGTVTAAPEGTGTVIVLRLPRATTG